MPLETGTVHIKQNPSYITDANKPTCLLRLLLKHMAHSLLNQANHPVSTKALLHALYEIFSIKLDKRVPNLISSSNTNVAYCKKN